MRMKAFLSMLFVIFLQISLLFTPFTSAMQFIVINDAQNTRFDAEIGVTYTEEISQTIIQFIWDIFQQYNSSERVQVETITIYIDANLTDASGKAFAGEPVKHINISSKFVTEYQGDVKWGFTFLLHHEMTHILQYYGDYPYPMNLIEGIADYIMLKSNYFPPGLAKPGQGDRWDQGYDVTARFLDYCEELRSGFVAGLNQMMKDSYSDDFFMQLIGKPVDQLWNEYKAKYKQS